MTLLSIVVALILEQIRPLSQQRFVRAPLAAYAQFFEERYNDGDARHGLVAWWLAVLPAVAVMLALQWLLATTQPLSLLLNIAVLYLAMGFRQFSHFFTGIHLALRMGELQHARALLGEWRLAGAEQATSNEVARQAIEEALLASHRHVFAPLLWFVVTGPAGVLLYRLALFFRVRWGGDEYAGFGRFARRAFTVIDWVPIRITAAAFAVVGDFESALFCWRTQAAQWPDAGSGILLASGAGALGVRLGSPVHAQNDVIQRPELGMGEEADADFMQSTIGLVWRTLVLCLLLLALFWVGSWVGR